MSWTMRQLQLELTETHGLRADKVAFIAARVEADGYCPFVVAGRQYAATALKHRPGYAIVTVDEETTNG